MIRARFGKTAAGRLLLGAGALALLMPAIAGCEAGNGAPTLMFHAASAGAQTVVNGIRITNVFVLGAPSGSTLPAGSNAGLFLSLFNDGATDDTLESVSAAGAASVTLDGGTVAVPSETPVNLTGPQPSAVLNNLSAPLAVGRLRQGDPAVQERGPGDAPGSGGAAVVLLVDLLPGAQRRPDQHPGRHPGLHRGPEPDGDAERDADVTRTSAEC